MASAAGNGNVGVIDRRFLIVGRHNLMRIAVAVAARGRRSSAGFSRLGVRAVRPGLLGIGMALRAAHRLLHLAVIQALHIGVAIDAAEHAAVDGVLQLVAVDKKAHLLAVDLRRHGVVRVAGEAVLVLQLLAAVRRRGPDKQAHRKRLSEDSSCRVHVSEQMLRRASLQ